MLNTIAHKLLKILSNIMIIVKYRQNTLINKKRYIQITSNNRMILFFAHNTYNRTKCRCYREKRKKKKLRECLRDDFE